ncbi:DUF2225 domain-containing protein [Salisediminibacterium beveridgei]|uniref:DUF2225 domain-containing protein n=1 Tax=Salisediminibacterium beveridgei TaxID=632773 RepID=A0A1D7QWR5_9BACI|nr:DUF2225 domain-containing protein [Salisediminibacterium beveridgei]AOM83446.1 hypothetical protein BBEV_2088 [Salisediminibacterium beveridgei]
MAEAIPPFYDKSVSCDVCTHVFTSKKMRSRYIRVERVENDYYKVYKDPLLNPLLYEVAVCPECGYSHTESFLPIKKPEVIDRFKAAVSSSWNSRRFDDERDYEAGLGVFKLALLSAQVTGQPHALMGSLCLRIAWIQRFLTNEAEEIRFLKKAADQFEKSFLEGDFRDTQMSEISLLFILGECFRRIDEKQKARKYFSKVIEHKDRHLEPQLVERTREQWYETKAK